MTSTPHNEDDLYSDIRVLEQIIRDTKERITENQKAIERLDTRVSNLEYWRSSIVGALLLLGSLLGLFFKEWEFVHKAP